MRIGPFGIWEILIILIVVLLVFGPRRLPEMAKGLGQSVRAFRKEMRDIRADLDMDPSPTRTASATAAGAPESGSTAPATSAPAPIPESEARSTTPGEPTPAREGGEGRG